MPPRRLLRRAQHILRTINPPPTDHKIDQHLDLVFEVSLQVRQAQRQLRRASERGWHLAARRIRSQLDRELAALTAHVTDGRTALAAPSTQGDPREVYSELRQLADEFGDVRYDADRRCVIVATDPITLQETPLGRFEISLPVEASPRPAAAVRVRALDPNPAGASPEVTHPHVSNERLCCGDGGAPLNGALTSHRFCDAALVVRSVLTHYNPDSAYVALENWHGVPCGECDLTVAEDDAEACQDCSDRFCEDCTRLCGCCDEVTCLSCAGTCASCHDRCCQPCLHPCATCEETTCDGCLESGTCPTCREQQEASDATNEEQTLLAD